MKPEEIVEKDFTSLTGGKAVVTPSGQCLKLRRVSVVKSVGVEKGRNHS